MKYLAVLTLAVLVVAPSALAADATLTRVMPRGATRGTEVELTFTGNHLEDAQEVLFYEPGITVKALKAENPTKLKATVAVAPDARLGEYKLRVRTGTGLSHLRTLVVGALPAVDESAPNNEFVAEQLIVLNITVAGVIEGEGLVYSVVEANKRQHSAAVAEGVRLGSGRMFDLFVAFLYEE